MSLATNGSPLRPPCQGLAGPLALLPAAGTSSKHPGRSNRDSMRSNARRALLQLRLNVLGMQPAHADPRGGMHVAAASGSSSRPPSFAEHSQRPQFSGWQSQQQRAGPAWQKSVQRPSTSDGQQRNLSTRVEQMESVRSMRLSAEARRREGHHPPIGASAPLPPAPVHLRPPQPSAQRQRASSQQPAAAAGQQRRQGSQAPVGALAQRVDPAELELKSPQSSFAQQLAERVQSSNGVSTSGNLLDGSAIPPLGTLTADSTAAAEDEEDAEPIARQNMREVPENVYVVSNRQDAARVAHLLQTQHRDRVFGADTEVMSIDVTKESPCARGKVICFSLYCGEELDLVDGPNNGVAKCMLWVDTYFPDKPGEETAIFEAFREFFEDSGIKKVWHNYSFDRHVFQRMGINCRGFHADTMHMARLWDSSRMMGKGGGYSLEGLTGDDSLMGTHIDAEEGGGPKISMKKLFQKPNIKKDGSPGKLKVLPAMEEIQTDPESRARWIFYSALDAKATWQLYNALKEQLQAMPCQEECFGSKGPQRPAGYSMWDMYCNYWAPFGELLTDMEREGVQVNREHLAEAEKRAVKDQTEARQRFRDWATSRVPNAKHMNVGSGAQIKQLLFAGVENQKKPKEGSKQPVETLEMSRIFKMPNEDGYIEEGKKRPKKTRDIELYGLWGKDQPSKLTPEVFTPTGWPAVSTPVLRSLAGRPGAAKAALAELTGSTADTGLSDMVAEREGLEGELVDDEWSVDDEEINAKAASQPVAEPVSEQQLEEEAKAKGYGRLYAALSGGKDGLEACAAVDALCESNAIDTLLSNFILPLQQDDISTADEAGNSRVHCSLNINTETGRLSARRPNLQNQPALEKDRYKVRQAFTAKDGHTLIVADYGQLELRLLAAMANCESMQQAFKLGGDFHSRTALGMYDHIQQAVAEGKCLLEWDGADGEEPPVPLLKNMFANERRKAKVLNFSIAYGKTAHGLAKDFKTDLTEAQETVNKWYSDRPEVKIWQAKQEKRAEHKGFVMTMLGRRRQLPGAQIPEKGKVSLADRKKRGHAMRAAINTPIQGSAADVATAAMLEIASNERLHELGAKLLLQIHDEVIVEVPEDDAEEAKQIVVECMEKPFGGVNPLEVALNVDANYAKTWYEAK